MTLAEIVEFLQSKGYLQGGRGMSVTTSLSDKIFDFFKSKGKGRGLSPHELTLQFVQEHPDYNFLEVNSEIWYMIREKRLVETGLMFGCYKIPEQEFEA